MRTNLHATLALLLAAALASAGCVSEPSQRVVDFSSVGDAQPGASFTLTVHVVGADPNGTAPITGAFVGAAVESQAVAKSKTGADGKATLQLQKRQTITVVAQAPGWTTEDSGSISIGGGSESQESLCFAIADVCVVTISNEAASYTLSGDAGAVTIVLFRQQVSVVYPISTNARAHLLVAGLPDSRNWVATKAVLNKEPELHRLYMLRLVDLQASLEWRNTLLEQADFELGVSCNPTSPQARTSGNTPYLAQQSSPVKLGLTWKPSKGNFWWSPCQDVYVGPITDTVNTPITPKAGLELNFAGRSSIVPVST